jgi:DNA-directed RNA polymerase subunit N (RpoN/RPB10)
MRTACQRCGEEVSLLFPSLGRNVCFACLASVMRLTSGYASLREMAVSDMGNAITELGRREHRSTDATHCIRCFSAGAAIAGPVGRLCLACSLALVAG